MIPHRRRRRHTAHSLPHAIIPGQERLPFIALDPPLPYPPFVRQSDSTFEMPSLALQGLLADLTRDFHGEQHGQSVDVLQYCADWFQAKLRSEASHLPMTIL